MESIYDLMRQLYGRDYLPTYDGKRERRTRRTLGKHQATKRGYQHKHCLSRGERNHLKFLRQS
jgi:hypothetical protein